MSAPTQAAPNNGHRNPAHHQHPSPGQPVYHQLQVQQVGFNLSVNLNYLKSEAGIFKCIEIVVLVVAFATARKFKEIFPALSETGHVFTDEKVEFLLGATISGFVLCNLIVFVFLLGLNKSCGVSTNAIVLVALFHMAWVVMLGGGSGALAYRAHQCVDGLWQQGTTLSQLPEPFKTQMNCLLAAVASGFLATFHFVIDVVLHYKIYTATKDPACQHPVTAPVQQPHGNQLPETRV